MREASHVSPLISGRSLMARGAKEDELMGCLLLSFPHANEPQVPEKSQPGRETGLAELLPMLWRAHKWLEWHHHQKYIPSPSCPHPSPPITGSLGVKACTSLMHPNPASPPILHRRGGSFITCLGRGLHSLSVDIWPQRPPN